MPVFFSTMFQELSLPGTKEYPINPGPINGSENSLETIIRFNKHLTNTLILKTGQSRVTKKKKKKKTTEDLRDKKDVLVIPRLKINFVQPTSLFP